VQWCLDQRTKAVEHFQARAKPMGDIRQFGSRIACQMCDPLAYFGTFVS
jgi:hypothetical protein